MSGEFLLIGDRVLAKDDRGEEWPGVVTADHGGSPVTLPKAYTVQLDAHPRLTKVTVSYADVRKA